MSASEIIEQLKALSVEERRVVLSKFSEDLRQPTSLYDEFTLIGDHSESDVSYAAHAQAEVIKNDCA
jgi:hypothetical protein